MLPCHSACKGSAGSGLIVGRGGRPGGQASRNIRTRHYARPRGDAAHITRAHYAAAPRCGARLGIPRVVVRSRCGRARWMSVGAPDSRRRAIGAVRGLALCAKFVSRHYARNIRPRITRAARWGHRALPPLHTRALPVGDPHSVAGLPTMLRRWRAQRIRREFRPSPMWRARHTRPRHVQCFPATGAREHADCPPYHRETSHRT